MEAISPLQDPTVPEIRYALGACVYGSVLVAESAVGICSIALGNDPVALRRDLADRHPAAAEVDDADVATRVADVIAFVEAPETDDPRLLNLPLDLRGSEFQRRVWLALRDIPVGSTMTYAEVARHIGAPTAVRAVAHACATNVLAVVIPCHRVVRSDGGLSGYRWGVERKRALLAREQGVVGLFGSAGATGGVDG